MSLDRWLALAGIVLGIAGLILTAVVAVRVRPMPALVRRMTVAAASRMRTAASVGRRDSVSSDAVELPPSAGDAVVASAPSEPDADDDRGPRDRSATGSHSDDGSTDDGSAHDGSATDRHSDDGSANDSDPADRQARVGRTPDSAPAGSDPGVGSAPDQGPAGSDPGDWGPEDSGADSRPAERGPDDRLPAERGPDDRLPAERGPDDELATSTVLTGVALWLAAVLGIGFATTEVKVAQVVAQVALALSVAGIALLIWQWRRDTARYLSWLANLFVVDAAIAATPGWLARPAYSQGRFDDLATWLPSSGSVNDRLDDALKDYGAGVVAHVVVQALGWAMLIALAMYVIANIVRRARDRREPRRQGWWAAPIVLVVAAVGVICASGSAVAVSIRTFGHGSFATARAGSTTGSDAPALALRADKRGRVSLLVGRCGNDRILALTVDGRAIGDGIGVPHGGGVLSVPLPTRPRTAPVTVTFRSTRRFDTTVVFASRPRAGRFLPLRTKDTLRAFDARGHAC